jgi:hypothetical protein
MLIQRSELGDDDGMRSDTTHVPARHVVVRLDRIE